jgi:membrane-associated phospholipid phosphatase
MKSEMKDPVAAEPDADTGTDASASTGALVGRCLRDGFDRESLRRFVVAYQAARPLTLGELWALAISAILGTLFVHGLKPLLSMPRPPAVLAADAITIIGPALRGKAFPSGHTTTIFLAAGLVWLHFRSMPLRAAAVSVALVAGLSRAVVGVHWPMDIAAGAAGGWTCAIVGTALAHRWAATGSRRITRALLQALGGACGLILLTGSGTGYPQAIALQYAAGVVGLVVPAWMALGDFRQRRRKET